MKKPQTATEKPLDTTKEEQAITTKAAPKKTKTTSPATKKTESVAANAKPEPATATAKTKETPKKSASKPVAAKKAEIETQNLTIAERVGLTAGSIWHYLSENGATPVSKLVEALAEDEKIIQRSIGWLAQEDKIGIDLENRVETLSLKS